MGGEWGLSPTAVFIFSGTLALYGIHRLIGLKLLNGKNVSQRFQTISRLNREIIVYTILAGIVAAVSFLLLTRTLQLHLLAPGLLALLYALPLFRKKRLRDLPYIKIFLIALVWTWLTVWIPAIELQQFGQNTWLMLLERACFLFGITLPFDLRDRETDHRAGIKTLPALMDVRPLGSLALAASFSFAALNYRLGFYAQTTLWGIGISLLIAIILLWLSPNITHDYFFSGLIDGLMILQFIAVYFL